MNFKSKVASLTYPTILSIALLAAAGPSPATRPEDESALLKTRETVWRAWFANDTATLAKLVPEETIVISASDEKWKHQAEVLREAAEFQAEGGKLIQLEFPHTEVQHFGDVAIIWSNYRFETDVKGKRSVSLGRVTEIFCPS